MVVRLRIIKKNFVCGRNENGLRTKIISSADEIFFIYDGFNCEVLAVPKLLSLEKTQVNLFFFSLNRIFASSSHILSL